MGGINRRTFLAGASAFAAVLAAPHVAGAVARARRARFLGPVQEKQVDDVVLPRLEVTSPVGNFVLPSARLRMPPLPESQVIENSFNIRFRQRNPIGARYWHADTLRVRRRSDGTELRQGVDFDARSPFGFVYGLVDRESFPVSVECATRGSRVDRIILRGRDLHVLPGSATTGDPGNLRAPLDKEDILLAEVLVHRGGSVILDRTGHDSHTMVRYGDENAIDDLRRWNESCIGQLSVDENLTWIAYGDSITACAGGWGAEWQTVPGGPTRDVRGYLSCQTSDAGLTRMGTPVVTESDGVDHWYGSYNRRVAQALTGRGFAVDFKNLGIGGTQSGTRGSGKKSDRYDGAHPARLAGLYRAKGAGKNIVCIGFTTNEDDNDTMVENLVRIARFCLDNGMTPILIGQPPIATVTRSAERLWRNDQRVIRAARAVPCAYVPLTSMLGYANKGASGIFPDLASGAGGVNHPGIYEHMIYGKWIDYLCFGATRR